MIVQYSVAARRAARWFIVIRVGMLLLATLLWTPLLFASFVAVLPVACSALYAPSQDFLSSAFFDLSFGLSVSPVCL